MQTIHYILIGIGAIVLFLLLVIIGRTLAFKPRERKMIEKSDESFDSERVISNLQNLVKCRTVSNYSHDFEDEAEFSKLINILPELYPNVYRKCTLTAFPDRGLLYKWEGKRSEAPTVLMAHYDVVPVKEDSWEKPPFEGVLEDGVLWGRGTLDTKVTFGAALFAVDHLIGLGFVPENDLYLAFSGGEEVNGNGAVHIVDFFEKEGIQPALVLDEGGAVVENVFPGVKQPCALIGTAEKGLLDLEYKTTSKGGHASAPTPLSPLVRLSRAVVRLEKHQFKSHLSEPVRQMFDTLGRHSSFLYRMIFANLWAFGWVLSLMCKKKGGELNALMRTTVAFTVARGSTTANVIPPEATVVSNIRLNPSDTMESAIRYIKKTVKDENIILTPLRGMDPSRISEVGTLGYKRVEEAILSTWGDVIVSPYLMVQCSDSRHWGRLSDKVYRFSAMALSSEERATIHGHNERIKVDVARKAAEFYIKLIKSC